MDLVNRGINPIGFPGLKLSVSSDDSKAINFNSEPKVIVSAAGMCDAGRIRHHLKHNLWRQECTIVFAGYQAIGTLGRSLIDGAEVVKLFGETIDVEAEIVRLDGLSGHADREGLLTWINAFKKKPDRVFMVHGDDLVCTKFANLLRSDYDLVADAPFSGSEFDLAAGVTDRRYPDPERDSETEGEQVHLCSSCGSRRALDADHPEKPRLRKQGYQEIYGGGQCPLRKMGSLTAA